MIKKVFKVLWKSATAYVVAGFALIQLASVVVNNVSIKDTLGISQELFMQTLFIGEFGSLNKQRTQLHLVQL